MDCTDPDSARVELKENVVSFGTFRTDMMTSQAAVAFLVSVFVIVSFYLTLSPPDFQYDDLKIASPQQIEVNSHTELIEKLKELDLWELSEEGELPGVVFASFPEDFDDIEARMKKKAFFHTLLPVAVVALNEVKKEREVFVNILKKFGPEIDDLVFTIDYASWGRRLTLKEINFVLELSRKYRTPRAVKLLNRINVVPVSLILAQGAIESSWGTSRFAKAGNNLFGVWTWGEKGIVPSGRDAGKMHKIASYETILESVRAYVVNLNRQPAYRDFRKIRQFSMDSGELAEGLLYYSERREEYVWEIQKLIRQNELKSFDTFIFDEEEIYADKSAIWLTSLETR